MHDLEPYFNWRSLYTAEEDKNSPFFGREYSELYFSECIYNHYIHPQWDNIGSPTLFIKILFTDYDDGYAIIEMIGEWNDLLHNDIMFLKRNIIENLMAKSICKFILIGENVLNFHASDDCYYEEWFDETEEQDGWIATINFRDHVLEAFSEANIDRYLIMGGKFCEVAWRTLHPVQLFQTISEYACARLGE